jgi:hypothetical protein
MLLHRADARFRQYLLEQFGGATHSLPSPVNPDDEKVHRGLHIRTRKLGSGINPSPTVKPRVHQFYRLSVTGT